MSPQSNHPSMHALRKPQLCEAAGAQLNCGRCLTCWASAVLAGNSCGMLAGTQFAPVATVTTSTPSLGLLPGEAAGCICTWPGRQVHCTESPSASPSWQCSRTGSPIPVASLGIGGEGGVNGQTPKMILCFVWGRFLPTLSIGCDVTPAWHAVCSFGPSVLSCLAVAPP